jgi:hypothetical protein
MSDTEILKNIKNLEKEEKMKKRSPKKVLSSIEEKSGQKSYHKSRQSVIEMRRNS